MSSKDEFIDLQIEESLSREMLMHIDTANTKEDCSTITVYLILIFLIFFIGIKGPPPEKSILNERIFLNNKNSVIFSLDNITEWNHFIIFSYQFLYNSFNETLIINNFNFEVTLTFLKSSQIISVPKKISKILKISINNLNNFENLYFDHYPIYNEIKALVQIQTPNKNIKGIRIKWEFGDSSYPITQIIFRLMYAFVCILSFLMFLIRLITIPYRNWHLEQKITSYLVFFCILADNPLYIQQLIWPSQFGAWLDLIFLTLYKVYFRFFIIVLFDSLRYQNRKIYSYFYVPKILFIIINFIIELIYSILNSKEIILNNFYFNQNHLLLFKYLEIFLSIIFYIWVIIVTFKSYLFIDITERYKFNIYIIISIISFLIIISNQFVFQQISLFSNSSLSFLLSFSIQNFFVILMIAFHWPRESILDQNIGYISPEEEIVK